MWLYGFMWLSGEKRRKAAKSGEELEKVVKKWWKTSKSGEELEKSGEKRIWPKVKLGQV